MALLKAVLITLLLALAHSDYQLDFDWTLSKLSSDSEYGYVVWNGQIIYKIQELEKENTLHHAQIKVDFSEGQNQLNFSFSGKSAELTIGSVTITEPPKTINLLANGDFRWPILNSTQTARVFSNSILGWDGPQIEMVNTDKLGSLPRQALLLNPLNSMINQKVIFGKVPKYSFLTSISADLQVLTSSISNV